ncbi:MULTISPECIES: phenylpyruvate tautomerase MIF-related protein [Ruminococcus]|uniref:phenylpyruvate tautomerase MIF-related protein n=1 Tax=Ruminococcus TaxID=1263 RepID=UPI000E44347E|nr:MULTISPECIES: phenylpyruvate tautomerase MIF-related protein [Ruminococcus]RGM80772.1 hypothetical protein DXB92_05965 [Ruminococcus sp. OM06-36AC]
MPFIKLKTNCAVPAATADTIQKHLGLAITAIPGKIADWLMVEVEDNRQLFFRGTNEPAAIAEVSLYGNASANALETLTSHITGILLDTLKIPTDRVYVSYAMTEHWGWNGSNF